jgi:hypothetical protein
MIKGSNKSEIKFDNMLDSQHAKKVVNTKVKITEFAVKIRILCFSCMILLTFTNSFAGSYPVYDALIYKNKPELTAVGLLPIRVVYEGQMWLPNDDKNIVNETQIIKVAKSIEQNEIVCLDIEYWPTTGTLETVKSSIEKYNKVLSLYKKYSPDVAIGYYGILPRRDYHRSRKVLGTTAYGEWKKENDSLNDIAQKVDLIFPSLYTFTADIDDWKEYAIENIKEAKRYGKPVYVFLWPMYHDSTKYKGKYIPADFWRIQLETCHEYANGIVIWGGWQENWNENASWWKETKSFLKKIQNDNDHKKLFPPILKDIY